MMTFRNALTTLKRVSAASKTPGRIGATVAQVTTIEGTTDIEIPIGRSRLEVNRLWSGGPQQPSFGFPEATVLLRLPQTDIASGWYASRSLEDALKGAGEPTAYADPMFRWTNLPEPHEAGTVRRMVFEAESFRLALRQCQHAMARDDVRYYLNGLRLGGVKTDRKETCYAVATDGHRMVEVTLALQDGSSKLDRSSREDTIVPANTIDALIKALGNKALPAGQTVAVEHVKHRQKVVDRTHAQFRPRSMAIIWLPDGARLKVDLIDGHFPDWKTIIPKNLNAGNVRVRVKTPALVADAIREALALAKATHDATYAENTKPPKFGGSYRGPKDLTTHVIVNGESLSFKALNPEAPKKTQSWKLERAVLPVRTALGHDAMEGGFNTRYLLDACDALDRKAPASLLFEDLRTGKHSHFYNGAFIVQGNTIVVVMPTRL